MSFQYAYFIAAAVFFVMSVMKKEQKMLWFSLGLAFAAGGALPLFHLPATTIIFIVAGVFVALAVGDFIVSGFTITDRQKNWLLIAAIFVAMNIIG